MAQTRKFNVRAQPAATGIPELARQADIQILVSERAVRGKKTNTVRGEMTVDQALRRLVVGTGLQIAANDGRTYSLVANAPEDRAAAAPGERDDQAGKSEILVIGSRSLNADIVRTRDDIQPYVVFKREDIRNSPAVNLEDFLRTRLPMNAAAGQAAQAPGTGSTISSINLRGLGANQTLILVDGRRMPNSIFQNEINQPDINGIPLASIERIEVLPSSSSGIYGGEATGGTINIVLRRDYRGADLRVTYSDTFDGALPAVRLEGNASFSLENGRTRITASGAWSKSGVLYVGERDFFSRSRGLLLRNSPSSFDPQGVAPPFGNAVNIRTDSPALTLKPQFGGATLSARYTNVPVGYSPAADNGALLRANAGSYDLDLPEGPNGTELSLYSSPEIISGNVNLRREMWRWLDVFADYSTFINRGEARSAQAAPNVLTLDAAAPTNPFQQSIRVTIPLPDISYPFETESRTDRYAGGLIARLGGEWTAGLDYSQVRSKFSRTAASAVIDAVGSCVIQRGLPTAGTDPDGAGPLLACAPASDTRPGLNPFQQMDLTPYLLPIPNAFAGPYRSTVYDTALRVSGPLIDLPAGPVNLSASLQRNVTHIERGYARAIDNRTLQTIYYVFSPRYQRFYAAYGEVRLPVFSDKNERSLFRALEFQGSVRVDRYSTVSDPSTFYAVPSFDPPFPEVKETTVRYNAVSYTVGGRYSPVHGLVARASYGTGFLPPRANQIGPIEQIFPFPVARDPLRGNTLMSAPFTIVSGGGTADLRPEYSNSLSAGVIVQPRFLPGFRFSADYTRIRKRDEIQTNPPGQLIVDNPDAFPGRVVRGPNLPMDPVGWAGPITRLDVSTINIARTHVEAVDFQLDQDVQTKAAGLFHLYAIATWQPTYRYQLLPTLPEVATVGFIDGPLPWRGNAGLDWSKDGLKVRWNIQFYDRYRIYGATATSTARDSAILRQGDAFIPVQTYQDLQVTYRVAAETGGVLGGVEITGSIQNLWNQSPPILAQFDGRTVGYSPYGDPRLRRFALSLRKSIQ